MCLKTNITFMSSILFHLQCCKGNLYIGNLGQAHYVRSVIDGNDSYCRNDSSSMEFLLFRRVNLEHPISLQICNGTTNITAGLFILQINNTILNLILLQFSEFACQEKLRIATTYLFAPIKINFQKKLLSVKHVPEYFLRLLLRSYLARNTPLIGEKGTKMLFLGPTEQG